MASIDYPIERSYRCRLDWGREGARRAAARSDVLVVVDVLSFSTAVAVAVERGGLVYPCPEREDPAALARQVGAEVAVRREAVPARGRFSLSPLTFRDLEPGTRVVLPSPNGATCSACASAVPCLFAGTLVNSRAVAAVVSAVLTETPLNITVLACGERWEPPGEDGPLRVAVEDYLGVGAILSGLPGPKSPEARVCESAFLAAKSDLAALLWDCDSGRELRARGFGEDVRCAAQLDVCDIAPVLRHGRFACLLPNPNPARNP